MLSTYLSTCIHICNIIIINICIISRGYIWSNLGTPPFLETGEQVTPHNALFLMTEASCEAKLMSSEMEPQGDLNGLRLICLLGSQKKKTITKQNYIYIYIYIH